MNMLPAPTLKVDLLVPASLVIRVMELSVQVISIYRTTINSEFTGPLMIQWWAGLAHRVSQLYELLIYNILYESIIEKSTNTMRKLHSPISCVINGSVSEFHCNILLSLL